MSHAALLSSGPYTLGLYPGPERYDLRIGVNTAASLHEVEWWSCADAHRFQEIEPIGLPKLLSIAAERDKMRSRCPKKIEPFDVWTWEELWPAVGLKKPGKMWSATAALALAVHLGVRQLDCFGVDLKGADDAAGEVPPNVRHHRNEGRWAKERAKWDELVGWARSKGCKVNRISHENDLLHPDQV